MNEGEVNILLIVFKWGTLIILGTILIATSMFQTKQQTLGVVERFGKFNRRVTPGLNFKLPFIEKVAYSPSLRTEQKDVEVESITSDKVSVGIKVSIWVRILPEKVYDAVYKLDDPYPQIESSVFDVVRAQIPKLTLDNCFERKDDIGSAVLSELKNTMDDYGYAIDKALITDIDPDEKVKASMNAINAAQRDRQAALEKGEAEKILAIKQAEADAERKRLQGEGIAQQRLAITTGLQKSVEDFQKAVKGASSQDVLFTVLMTQYFDTLKEIAGSSKSHVVFASHNPGMLSEYRDQMQSAIFATNREE